MANVTKAFARWKEVIIITVLVRISLFILSLLLNHNFYTALASWIHWDGPHYLDIAQYGYQSEGINSLWIVFYPLYPLFIKIFSFLIPNFFLAAIVVSIFFSFVAAVALFELVLLDFNRRVAILSIWFMSIFPTSFFFQASYTESLFLSFSILTIYFFRKKSFWLSGLAGVFSSLTRANGILLLPSLLFEKKSLKSALPTFLITPLGFLSYFIINYFVFHDFFYFVKPLYLNWFKKIDWPWVGISNLIKSIPPITHPDFYIYFSEIISILLISFFCIYCLLKIRKSYGVYILLNLILMTSTNFILSTPRYSLALFPIFIILGMIQNKNLIFILSACFIILLAFLTTFYIQGKWAF